MRQLLFVALALACAAGAHGADVAAAARSGPHPSSVRRQRPRVGANDESSPRKRRLQNKITSNHLVTLEYSGVTYPSYNLNLVKADLVEVVEDVLIEHLTDGVEVLNVRRVNIRRQRRAEEGSVLRHPSSRRLSYILLTVKVSLRHPSWISSERSLDATIDTLSEYVDQDFRRYIRALPGNGDYVGTVDVREAYNDFAIGVPNTPKPTARPAGDTSTGSFQTELVFVEVPPTHGNTEVLRNYIQYGVTRILNKYLDPAIIAVDVSLLTWAPKLYNAGEMWLHFPMMITLQYQTSQGLAFSHSEDVLRQNVGDLDLYLDDYIATTSLSDAEKLELEFALKDVFGEMASVEISEENPTPTSAPIKPADPARGWLQTAADEAEEMPWWGWLLVGLGLSMIVALCCCIALQCMRRKRTDTTREVANIHVPEQADPVVLQIRPADKSKKVDRKKKRRKGKDADGTKLSITMKECSGNDAPYQQQLVVYDPNPATDLVLYEPNFEAPDPEEHEKPMEPKSSKKGKQKKARDP